jgi:hypothetical protein
MLRHELNGMIHVPRLKHANAAGLLLGFRIGTVGRRDFPSRLEFDVCPELQLAHVRLTTS